MLPAAFKKLPALRRFSKHALLLLVTICCLSQSPLAKVSVSVELQVRPTALLEVGSVLWVGTNRGLFYQDKLSSELHARTRDDNQLPVGEVHALHWDGWRIWIGTEDGLFYLNALGEMRQALQGGAIYAIYATSRKTLWLGDSYGLIRYDVDLDAPERIKGIEGPVLSIQGSEESLWIGTEYDVFRWDNLKNYSPYQQQNVDPGKRSLPQRYGAYILYFSGSTLLIGNSRGLYRWADVNKGQAERIFGQPREDDSSRQPDQVFTFFSQGGKVFVGTASGLLRLDHLTEGTPQVVQEISGPITVMATHEKKVVLGNNTGLYTLPLVSDDLRIKIKSKLPSTIYTDYPLFIEWDVAGIDVVEAKKFHYFVSVKDQNGRELQAGGISAPAGQMAAGVPALPLGNYSLEVQAQDMLGNKITSAAVEFPVYSSGQDVILRWVKTISLVYSIASLSVFVLLVIGARWSRRCFALLTDPLMRKFGFYFGFALRHLRFIRLWVFERYFRKIKAEFGTYIEYVPGPLLTPDGSEIVTSHLIGRLGKSFDHTPSFLSTTLKQSSIGPHLWVRGEPGTGKTAMIRELMRTYCSARSLRAAWKQYHFIPIVITLRDYGGLPIPELARAALDSSEMSFADDSFFDLLLGTGGFLLVLDGLNEVNIDNQVIRFAVTHPSVGLLMTSQTSLSNSKILTYQLPSVTPHFARQLLDSFLRDRKGNVPEVKATLWDDIKSGYDVRLIENLINANQPLPKDRISLYNATMDFAASQFEGIYHWDVVCRHAWNLWKTGQRRFQSGAELTAALTTPLLQAKIIVPRGDQYEYRHDLMRGYLAASWAVDHAASIEVTCRRLSEDDLWNLSPSEQDLVFPFVANLIQSPADLQAVAQFAASSVEQRTRLLVAVQEVAASKSWKVSIKLNEPMETLAVL